MQIGLIISLLFNLIFLIGYLIKLKKESWEVVWADTFYWHVSSYVTVEHKEYFYIEILRSNRNQYKMKSNTNDYKNHSGYITAFNKLKELKEADKQKQRLLAECKYS